MCLHVLVFACHRRFVIGKYSNEGIIIIIIITPLSFGIPLRLLMLTNWNASSRSLQPFVIIVSFAMFIIAMPML
jgi:hypothetical protein